jgi:hypothetical protein
VEVGGIQDWIGRRGLGDRESLKIAPGPPCAVTRAALGVLDHRGEPLVHGAQELPRAPGLHFVGYDVTLGGTIRLIGIEAMQLARAVASAG